MVLVDADYDAPAVDVMLNVSGRRTMGELFERPGAVDSDLLEGVLQRHVSGVRVLAAVSRRQLGYSFSMAQTERLLVLLKEMFGWTVVDLGHPLDDVGLGICDAADGVLMVCHRKWPRCEVRMPCWSNCTRAGMRTARSGRCSIERPPAMPSLVARSSGA